MRMLDFTDKDMNCYSVGAMAQFGSINLSYSVYGVRRLSVCVAPLISSVQVISWKEIEISSK